MLKNMLRKLKLSSKLAVTIDSPVKVKCNTDSASF